MRGDDSTDSDSNEHRSSVIRRRDVLRSTAGLAVGTAGLAATSGSASATIESLFEALRCTSGWQDAPEDYPVLDLRDSSPSRIGDWPGDPETLTIFVHGLGGDSNEGWRNQAATFESAAQQNGWDPTQIAVLYTTSGDSLDWSVARNRAKTAGQRLANWLLDFDASNDVSSYNVVAHSLGGHVTGTLLNELDGAVTIDNVGLLGPAIPNDSVCADDGEYAPGIEASAGEVHNYRSWDDEVVCDLYESYVLGAGTDGLGCNSPSCGLFDAPPSNFFDHSQTVSVNEHCDYPKADVGCVDDLVGDFGTA